MRTAPKGVVMRKLSVILFALVYSPASAQGVSVHTFGAEAPEAFQEIVPGSPVTPAPPVDAGASSPETALLDYMASQRAPSPEGETPTLPIVPGWMRAGRVSSSPFSPLRIDSSASCGSEGYFPRYGISVDAQARRSVYFDLIVQVACEVGVPVRLFDALIAQESRYRPYARSSAGAMGLSQLMPGTAAYLRVADPWHPEQNLRGGARYLKEQLDRFGSWELALAAYNAGPGRVVQYDGIPPFRETRDYVRTILASIDGGGGRPSFDRRGRPFRAVAISPFKLASHVPEN
jgi:hypothetical protein